MPLVAAGRSRQNARTPLHPHARGLVWTLFAGVALARCAGRRGRGRHYLLVAAIALVAASPGAAQQPANVLRGLVRDTEGRPLPEVEIISQRGNHRTMSNDSGQFVLDGLPRGTYRLLVRRLGYESVHPEVRVPAPDSLPLVIRLERRVQFMPEIVVEGTVPALRGVVGDSALRPIAGARVALLRARDSVMTGADGRFEFSNLKDGGYMLSVTHPDYAPKMLSLVIENGKGLQYSIRLGARSRRDWSPARWLTVTGELDRRLRSELRGTRMTRQELTRYGRSRLCDVMALRQIPGFPAPFILEDGHRRMSFWMDLCLWDVADLEMIEWGQDICVEATGSIADHLGISCAGPRMHRPRKGWVVLWERR